MVASDLVIIGGGPVGLGTALCAARRGLSATVIERRPLPLDKACGEGIMPGGVRFLHQLGVSLPTEHTAPFVGIRFLDGAHVAEARFASGPGLGVRRTTLIGAMVERAQAEGVQLLYGCAAGEWCREGAGVTVRTAQGLIRARWLIGADGLHSAVRRRARLERPAPDTQRYGIRRHFRVPTWSEFVEVHWSAEAEAYVTPVGPDEIGVAILWPGDGRRFDTLLELFPTLARRLSGAVASSAVRGAGPFHQRVRSRVAERIALVGDAAGYVDPVTGEGVSLGLRTAHAVVEVLATGEPLAAYDRRYRHLAREYTVLTNTLLVLRRYPGLRTAVIAALQRAPDLFDRLLAINAGQLPISSLGVGGMLRLAAEVVQARAQAWTAWRSGRVD
jgi:flavin-dependent dehydrogenase